MNRAGEQANIHLRFDSTGARGLASRKGLQTPSSSGRALPGVAGRNCRQTCSNQQGTGARDSCRLKYQTDRQAFAPSSVVRIWVLHRSRNTFAIQSRDDFDFVPCLRVTLKHMRRDRHELHITSLEARKVLYVATAIKFW